MNTLYVVAGSPWQRPLRLPSAQLYLGELFSVSITHARRFAKEEAGVRILSPKYGLLWQERLIEPDDLTLDQLDDSARTLLVQTLKNDLPPRGELPLRTVVLAPDDYVALFRTACAETRFESVPIRSPLSHLDTTQQIQWLQRATWPIECHTELPTTKQLFPHENARLHNAARAAATWWSELLMSHAPPPEPTLLADALALKLCQVWVEVAEKSRGEWPEDIAFSVTFQDVAGPIVAALSAIGLNPRQWWKREGAVRPPQVTMHFSMGRVTLESHGGKTVIFE